MEYNLLKHQLMNENVDEHDHLGTFNLIKEKGDVINAVSPTFCSAKWLQSTVLLYNGETHSCHHPSRHKIQLSDIKDNPQGIHNTVIKIHARQDMIDGIQTKECDYCWNIENLGKDYVSDRIYKSSYSWAWPHLKEVIESGTGKDIAPTYLEVAFESTCNFKCLYCSPESSSRWQEEVERHGPIKLKQYNLHDVNWLKSSGRWPIRHDEPNPYIDAFWKWWPELYPKLHTFRITGGEPLFSKHTWKILDYIRENPRKDLTLAINTNMNVPKNLQDKLVEYVRDISPNIKGFDIYTSLENTGEQAEYVRSGLDYNQFIENCSTIIESTGENTRLHIMTTINLMSAPTFINFLELIQQFREKYTLSKHDFRVRTFISYLRWPKCFSINMLSKEHKEKYAKEWIGFVKDFVITADIEHWQTFYIEELDQITRLCDYMLNSTSDPECFEDFRSYITTCDTRRQTNFNETFPELTYMLYPNYFG